MSILFKGNGISEFEPDAKKIFNEKCKKLNFYTTLSPVNSKEIKYLITWNPEKNIIKKLPNLEAIFTLGAGVDSLGDIRKIPKKIKIIRLLDAGMAEPIANYVLAFTIFFMNRIYLSFINRNRKKWSPFIPLDINSINIGVMGFGKIGEKVVKKLQKNKFNVIVWRKKRKKIPGIETFFGKNSFKSFLKKINVIVNVLPLTEENRFILNTDNFNNCNDGTFLINVARGAHIIDKDLKTAINSEKISMAVLDVFNQEPLPKSHPFWKNERIIITPHSAAPTNIDLACKQIIENINKIEKNITPLGLVNRADSY